MSEFSLVINQSLVSKTLEKIRFDPFVVIDHSDLTQVNSTSDEETLFFIDDLTRKFANIGSASVGVLDDNLELFINALTKSQKIESGVDPMEQFDNMDLGLNVVANYVLTFSSKFNLEIIKDAEEIRDSNILLSSLSIAQLEFRKKFWQKVKDFLKKAVQTIGDWIKKGFDVFEFKKLDIEKLRIVLRERPIVAIGNPIRFENVNPRLELFTVSIVFRWRFPFGKWKDQVIRITINDHVAAESSGSFELRIENNTKIFTYPSFSRFEFKVTVMGVKISFNITKRVNKVLQSKRFEIYDCEKISAPLQIAGLKYQVKGIQLVNLQVTEEDTSLTQNGLQINIGIDVNAG